MNKISESNKIRFYDYIVLYELDICNAFGHYNIKSKSVLQFCEEHKILIGSDCKKNEKMIHQYKYFILWDNTKPTKYKNVQTNDSGHNLLRHIRNAMAHGNIIAENRQTFSLKDYNSEKRRTMRGKISNKLFYELIEVIIATYF